MEYQNNQEFKKPSIEVRDEREFISDYQFSFFLTSDCNLNCYSCAYNCSSKNKRSFYITVEEVETALKKLKQVCSGELRRIILTGGEPTLHPQFKEICILARTYFPDRDVIIFTNGLNFKNFTQEDMEFFKEYKLSFYASYYPDEQILKEVTENSIRMIQNGVRFENFTNRSKIYFYKSGIKLTTGYTNRLQACIKRNEPFFFILNNTIYPCDMALFLYNSYQNLTVKDGLPLKDFVNENQLIELKTRKRDMCQHCSQDSCMNNGLVFWHKISDVNADDDGDIYTDLVDIFIYDYPKFYQLLHNDNKIIPFLKDGAYDYGIDHIHANEGYGRLLSRYITGKLDICIVFSSRSIINTQTLAQVKQLFNKYIYQKNTNIYCFLLDDLTAGQQKLILNIFSPREPYYNVHFLKEHKFNLNTFLVNSFSPEFVIINFDIANKQLSKNENYLQEHIRLRKNYE